MVGSIKIRSTKIKKDGSHYYNGICFGLEVHTTLNN